MQATVIGTNVLGPLAALLGLAGIIASAFIYLVPARPAWNMAHTPIDFLLSLALIGVTFPQSLASLPYLPPLHVPLYLVGATAAFWLANQIAKLVRLNRSQVFEHRASATLLNLPDLRAACIACVGLAVAVIVLTIVGNLPLAAVAAIAAVLLSRYLFFVSVVPLNMALTFTRGGAHT